MSAYLRASFFAAVLAVGASVILGSSATARGQELLRYSGGASAGGGGSVRSRYAGFPRGQAYYQVPAADSGAGTGYGYYYPQPVYPLPASSPASVTGYGYYPPQPTYQVPAAGPATIASYWYYYPVRR
jgi:hypothetical protein